MKLLNMSEDEKREHRRNQKRASEQRLRAIKSPIDKPPVQKELFEKEKKEPTHHSNFENIEFIGYDGEGADVIINGKKEHIYGLMMSSKGKSIVGLQGLSTIDCFKFLLEHGKEYPHHVHVCYGASYDVNMFLRDIPRSKIKELHQGKHVNWLNYKMSYIQRKYFMLWEYNPHYNYKKPDKKIPKFINRIVLWDVIGFFQGRFVDAIEKYLGKDYALLPLIEEGKKRRGSFTEEEIEHFVKKYCNAELTALVDVMKALHLALQEADLPIVRWDGAGAVATTLMKKYHIKEYKQETPAFVQMATQHAYAGGHIELIKYGNKQRTKIYHYDINSAYPDAMRYVCNLNGALWHSIVLPHWYQIEMQKREDNQFILYDVSWHFKEKLPFYPFFYRDEWGGIQFPQHGRNFMWGPELYACMECMPNYREEVYIHEMIVCIPANDIQPFSFLPELFEKRKIWKKNKNGAEKAMKLGINSLYGKTVQKVGYRSDDNQQSKEHIVKPPYHQLEWGGFITAYTRAKLYKAAMQSPFSIIAFATDGLFSTEALDIPLSSELGEWEFELHTGMTIVQSGVYWLYNGLEECRAWYRGFDKEQITRGKILHAWLHKQASISFPSTRFLTMGSALSGDKMWEQWRSWRTIDRELALDMRGVSKRDELLEVRRREPYKDFVPTIPSWNNVCVGTPFPYQIDQRSKQYPLPWQLQQKDDMIDGIASQAYEEECKESYS